MAVEDKKEAEAEAAIDLKQINSVIGRSRVSKVRNTEATRITAAPVLIGIGEPRHKYHLEEQVQLNVEAFTMKLMETRAKVATQYGSQGIDAASTTLQLPDNRHNEKHGHLDVKPRTQAKIPRR